MVVKRGCGMVGGEKSKSLILSKSCDGNLKRVGLMDFLIKVG